MSYAGGHPPDPQAGLPPGWIARYDQQSQHWFYINERTGTTTWERPGAGYGGPAPQQYGGGQQQYGGGQQQYGGAQPHPVDDRGYHQNWSNYQDDYAHSPSASVQPPQEAPKKNHNVAYGALGVGAGLLGGLFVAHEAGKVEDHFEDDKYRVENDYDRAKYDVEDAPDRLAGWAGNKVGDAEYDVDRAKYDVEDFPENAAGWAGRKVGDVEGDFDRVDDSYDYNRDEARDDRDDDRRDNYDDNGGDW